MKPVVYDAGALIAADRNDREFWADHRLRLEADVVPVVPAPVVVQVSRSSTQVQLRRLLRGTDVVDLDEDDAHAAGRLLGRTDTTDVVDAVVAHTATARGADVVTSDGDDIRRLLAAAGSKLRVIPV